MPRKDYDTLVAHADEWLPQGYEMVSGGKTEGYPYHFARIQDANSTYMMHRAYNFVGGLPVDVFPWTVWWGHHSNAAGTISAIVNGGRCFTSYIQTPTNMERDYEAASHFYYGDFSSHARCIRKWMTYADNGTVKRVHFGQTTITSQTKEYSPKKTTGHLFLSSLKAAHSWA
jgi:hypothetical protein